MAGVKLGGDNSIITLSLWVAWAIMQQSDVALSLSYFVRENALLESASVAPSSVCCALAVPRWQQRVLERARDTRWSLFAGFFNRRIESIGGIAGDQINLEQYLLATCFCPPLLSSISFLSRFEITTQSTMSSHWIGMMHVRLNSSLFTCDYFFLSITKIH